MAIILKAKRVFGNNVYLRDITEEDAKFVFDLRMDPNKSQYLSSISARVEDQRRWIRTYSTKNDQAYFIICDKLDNKLGCVRMYEPVGDTYCWGSWLIIDGLSPLVSIESAILVFAYGQFLGFKEARVDIRQANERVWRFHERFSSAVLAKEDVVSRHYSISSTNINNLLVKYKNLVTNPLCVIPLSQSD